MPAGFMWLVCAQFLSALADNALLIVAVAALSLQELPGWWAPLLKVAFTLFYVLLAPFVGPLSDAFPKARVMAVMNLLKLVGLAAMAAWVHPVLAYGIVGMAAAAYAPAKYGLVTEMVPAPRLVAANGWIEVSAVVAALGGAVVGGVMVSDWFLRSGVAQALRAVGGAAGGLSLGDEALLMLPSLTLLGLLYLLAGLCQLGVPPTGARYPACHVHPVTLVRDFVRANRTLWRDRQGGLSMAVTTLFWGVGATLQLAVLRWGDRALGLSLEHAAYLQAVVALGVVAGAGVAGRWVALDAAPRVLACGVALGLLITAAAASRALFVAVPLMVLVGAVGGLLVVPMNALLQHRGHELLSAGRSIAVQGFNENASVLLMLGLYAALSAQGLPVERLMAGFGGVIAVCMAVIMWRWHRLVAGVTT